MNTIGSTLPFWAIAFALAAAATTLVAMPLFKGRSRRIAVLMVIALPAAAVGVYLLVGSPSASVEAVAAEAPAAVPGAPTDAPPAGHTEKEIEELVATQKAKVETSPEDAAGWAALGMIYSGLDRWKEAEEAFAKAYALQPKEAAIVSAYAEALAINAGRDLSGRPMQLVREALELAAQDPKALELAGINAFQGQEYSKAAYYFRQLLKVLPEDSSYAEDVAGAMREAKRLAEEAAYGAPLDNRPPTDDVHSVARGTISGTVALDPALATRITGSEALFLYARPVLGGGPLAGLRTTVDKLPADFTLDDSLSPLPDNPLSSHDTVTLTARISPSGTAEPMPGDLEGTIRSVTVGSQGVKLVIDTVRP